jgi:RNase P/RNase MRP subunit POP5
MADHFVMVTTIITDESPDRRDLEDAAWKRLADEYGDEWVNMTKPLTKKVSIEGWEKVDDSDIYTVPTVGDSTDAGIAGE